jgi:hypothetical protein
MANETAAQKKEREASEQEAAAAAVQRPDEKARNTLTEGMPTPPGLRARRARRSARKARKGPFVKYVGAASHRIIRPHDWAQLAFTPKDKDQGHLTFTWDPKNDYMVESSKFTDEQLDYLLIDDVQHGTNAHSFLEVDYDDDGQLVQVLEEDEG